MITNAYAIVNRPKDLEIDSDRRKLIRDMTLQCVECAYFIRDQAQIESFCKFLKEITFTVPLTFRFIRQAGRQEYFVWSKMSTIKS